jgi:hypothetical protein
MRKSSQAKIKHLPIEQFLLITTPANRGPDPISPLMLIAAGIVWALTALITL